MLKGFMKKFKDKLKKRSPAPLNDKLNLTQRSIHIEDMQLAKSLHDNLDQLKSLLGNSYDLVIRRFSIGDHGMTAAIIYISGLEDSKAIDKIIFDLTTLLPMAAGDSTSPQRFYQEARNKVLRNEEVEPVQELSDLFDRLFLGDSILLFDGVGWGLICETKGWEVRNVEEPESERVIRGTRDGFVESLPVNTSLIRRRLRSPNLWIEKMEIGTVSKTQVAFAYLKGLAQEGLIKEVRTRLESIEIDGIIESGVIEELIEDTYLTPFPLLHRTERTDIAFSELLQGRVVIFTDGSSFALLVPTRLENMLQGPDDYFEKFPIGSFIRLGRMVSFIIAIFLPGIYVAAVNFHPELIPGTLLLRITAARQGVPFPAAIEVVLMEIVFELLREGGLRLPGMIGPAISIVGALILGDAAIRAGLVSPAVVIVVAATGIASFVAPAFSLGIAGRLIRFFMILFAATFGLFGLQLGFILLSLHLMSLRSFGYPYFAPYGPLILQDWKDTLVRLPWWLQKKRPKLEGGRDPDRLKRSRAQRPPRGLEDSEEDQGKNKGRVK